MDSKQVRTIFKEYFKSKGHTIVPSDSMVIKNDPTLMFTNAGMNQFKDIFLGIRKPEFLRVANSQKCLRVSGKHNDLEDVGHDTYHHTMFEMLGNWSFGDYFKEEAIEYAWDLLTNVYKIDKSRLYVTVFGGDKSEGLDIDTEAEEIWKKHVPADRIIYGSKKDNFWEMGDTGPCGPCSEIHIDLRDESEQKSIPGKSLVNKDHPEVIEIWNLVFIQYNRKADGSLEKLPQRHVDTGMGFERLCTVLQGKKSNYDTDVFQTIISRISELCGIKYGDSKKTDIALRVIADHLRAVSFAIADGQLPSNVKAGYVIRRILRRAVRYAYSFLNLKEAFIYKLVDTLVKQMGEDFPELIKQQELIEKVIKEEENVFLRTLERGIKLIETEIEECKSKDKKEISGDKAFLLYDTYGFPLDLTQLIAKENELGVNVEEFEKFMEEQRSRARNASEVAADDWINISDNDSDECVFTGYDTLTDEVRILKYRHVKSKNSEYYQVVFNRTPFYAESGGQIGDSGYISDGKNKYEVFNTIKEHNQIIHLMKKLPEDTKLVFTAYVDEEKRIEMANNHTATHLMHHALREILGNHVEQKGSLVANDRLRFDFTHFNKMTDEEIRKVEIRVNEMIRKGYKREEFREIEINEAKKLGAIMLFGEKYGSKVRAIKFGDSIELCGGTHVENTGSIGFFKIISESAIAAGIRRIEAITGKAAQNYIFEKLDMLQKISETLNNSKNPLLQIENLLKENSELKIQLQEFKQKEIIKIKMDLVEKANEVNGVKVISGVFDSVEIGDLKEICSQIRGEIDSFVCVLGTVCDGKPGILVAASQNIVEKNKINAGNIVKEAAKIIEGGGGGQAFLASAGGKNPNKISESVKFALEKVKESL